MLSKIADSVYSVQECSTVFPGEIKDFFNDSKVMKDYFQRVRDAEKEVFGEIGFLPQNVRQLAVRGGDLSGLSREVLAPALNSDYYIVFGSSYIKGWLIDFLINHHAVMIHMGVSPYYTGNSCNFWALYDGHPELVGATVHLLGKRLDSGNILYHALPAPEDVDPFVLGMKAAKAAEISLINRISNNELYRLTPVSQDKRKEYRKARNSDFTDDTVKKYLDNIFSPGEIKEALENREISMFINPFIT